MKNIPIGEVLIEDGYLNEEELKKALDEQEKDSSKRLGEILIERGFVKEIQVLEALTKRMDCKMINLQTASINIEAVNKIPKSRAVEYNLIGVYINDDKLGIAMSDPLDFDAIEKIKQITGMQIELFVCESKDIKNAINRYYSEIEINNMTNTAQAAASIEKLPLIETDIHFHDYDDEDAPVINLINSLLIEACSTNASDIHIEPFENLTSIRMRTDGLLTDYRTINKKLHNPVIARIKIMSELDITEKRKAQDGHFIKNIGGKELNVRVSIIPTVHGEKAVMRLLSADVPIDDSETFGMQREDFEKVSYMLENPNGIIYITGPTGSGKTTTLYMMLESLAGKPLNISTIEDPVEKNIKRVNQMQVNPTAGLTFDTGLRSLLRQDPDIIMVGETRDPETAATSVRASLTGHLVISTLHTNDALSSIVRLRDMGIESYLIANSVIGIIAQRLVRKNCPECTYESEPSEYEKKFLDKDIVRVKRGKGCRCCNNTGFKGRTAIHETAIIDRNIRAMITNGADLDSIRDYARDTLKMKSLKDSAMKLTKEGIIPPEELIRVTCYI